MGSAFFGLLGGYFLLSDERGDLMVTFVPFKKGKRGKYLVYRRFTHGFLSPMYFENLII